MKLGGHITTQAVGGVVITGAATITADTTITTAANAGVVKFTSTVDGSSAGGQELDILTDGAGTVTIAGVIGAATPLKTLDINASGTASGDMSIANIGKTDGTSYTYGVTGTTNIGHTTTGDLTLSGTVYNTGAANYQAKSTKSIKATGASPIFRGDVAANDDIKFETAGVVISNGTLKVITHGEDITFDGAITGSSGADEVVSLSTLG